MKVLFIVHATAWSDKKRRAEQPIMELMSQGRFDAVLEVIQSRRDIFDGRYLSHQGMVLQHDEISPVPFFEDRLFGPEPLFPATNDITLVGGVLNFGGGCLNEAFQHLVSYQQRLGSSYKITVPLSATYPMGDSPGWDDPRQVALVIKDLAWKLLTAGVSFTLSVDNHIVVNSGQDLLLELRIQTGSRVTDFL